LSRVAAASETRPEQRAAHAAPIDRSARLALLVFGAVVVIAVPLLVKLGDCQWLYYDEW
jgi:hypothetical protein